MTVGQTATTEITLPLGAGVEEGVIKGGSREEEEGVREEPSLPEASFGRQRTEARRGERENERSSPSGRRGKEYMRVGGAWGYESATSPPSKARTNLACLASALALALGSR